MALLITMGILFILGMIGSGYLFIKLSNWILDEITVTSDYSDDYNHYLNLCNTYKINPLSYNDEDWTDRYQSLLTNYILMSKSREGL